MLEKITEAEINERSMARVSTTPGRPTAFGQSNMDPEALKLRFDRLGRFLAGKINEILGSIEDGSISKNIKIKDDDGAEYILSDFILKMIEGDLTHINVVVPEGRQRLDVICNYVLRWNNEFYTGDFANEAVVVSGVTLRKFYEEFKAFEGKTAPVQSVNGETGDVELNAEDVGARPDTWMPSAEDVGAEPVGTAAFAVKTHNNNGESHQDIRRELKDLTDKMANAGAVKSVNGQTGDVTLNAEDVGARSNTWIPTAEQVGARPSNWLPSAEEIGARPNTWVPSAEEVGARPDNWMPSYSDVNADKAGTADSKVTVHNVNGVSHNDIRLLIQRLADRINAIANSTDVDLDDFKEVVAYIKANRGLIDAITTNKINYTDIINDLVTNVANKPLSAAQGVALKLLVDNLTSNKLDASALTSAINTALAQAKASGEFKGDDGKTPYIQNGYWYINGTSTGVKAQGNDGTSITVSSVTESTADGGSNVVTFSDGNTVNIKNGNKGSQGIQGFNIVASVDRPSFTTANWDTYGTVGREENWGGTSNEGVRVGDIFLVVGTATDTGIGHMLVYKYTGVKGGNTLSGQCLAHHIIAYRGAPGQNGKTPVIGTDYFTPADKTEMVNAVISALPKYNGGVS